MNKKGLKILFISAVVMIFALTEPCPAKQVPIQEGHIPETVMVTGWPATDSHIRSVLESILYRAGFKTDVLDALQLKTLSVGEALEVQVEMVPLEKGENEESPKPRTRKIKIKNKGVPELHPKILAFSNHPEKVKQPGVYFQAGILRNKPVRLRTYHLGDKDSQPHYLGVYLANNSKKPASVHILEAYGGPSKNWMMAGHMNNLKFLSKLESNQGRVEEIPPESAVPIQLFYLEPDNVISSTCDLNLMEGEPLQLVVYASRERGEDQEHPLITDETDRHTRGAYPLTCIESDLAFSLDESEVFYTIGDTRIADIFKGRDIRGNYGIIYHYNFTVYNPYREKRAVEFYFQPRGGIATATFLVNGETVSVGFTRAYQLVRLARIELDPESQKEVLIKTMPEDASNYPVRLILRPAR